MIIHPDGRLEGAPEEISQYQKLERERAVKEIKDWAKQWDSPARPPHYFYFPQLTCEHADKTYDQLKTQFFGRVQLYGGVY